MTRTSSPAGAARDANFFRSGAGIWLAGGIFLADSFAMRLEAESFQPLGFLPGTFAISEAKAVSRDGSTVVGRSLTQATIGADLREAAFLWRPESGIRKMDLPGLEESTAKDISADGSTVLIVGEDQRSYVSSPTLGLHWIGDLGVGGQARAISGDGRCVVGQRNTGGTGVHAPEAFRWTLETGVQGLGFTDATDVSADGSVIVGSLKTVLANGRPGSAPYVWRNGAGAVLVAEASLGTASAISADGTTIVGTYRGSGENHSTNYTFRVKGEVSILDSAAAYGFVFNPLAVSDDGSVIVGFKVLDATQAVVWTEAQGIRAVQDIFLDADLQASLAGRHLRSATAVSGDGRVIVGDGSGGDLTEAWRAELDPNFTFKVTAPAAGELVDPAHPYTIRFQTPAGTTAVDLFLVARSRTPGEPRSLIAENVPAAAGTYDWTVPNDLRSPSTFVIAVDSDDPTIRTISKSFRVRDPWRLHRVAGTPEHPEYEPFDPAEDVFSFLPQVPPTIWNPAFWQKPEFNYSTGPGFDPLSGPTVRYHPGYFGQRSASDYPPWRAVVTAFGRTNTYVSSIRHDWPQFDFRWNQPNPEAAAWWNWNLNSDPHYGGSSYGLSMTMMAAFRDLGGSIIDKWRSWYGWYGEGRLSDVPAADDVLDSIHELQLHQFGRQQQTESLASASLVDPITPTRFISQLKAMFEKDSRADDRVVLFESRMLSIDEAGHARWGAHAVVPVWMTRQGPEDSEDGLYTIGIIDPNRAPPGPNTRSNALLFVDTATDRWWHEDPQWLGDTGRGISLSMKAASAFGVPSPPWPPVYDAPDSEPLLRDRLAIRIIGKSGAVVSEAGELRLEGGVRTETLPKGQIRFPITGAASGPDHYAVPAATTYRAEAVPRADGMAGVRVTGGTVASSLLQSSATTTTRAVVDLHSDGLAVVSGGGGTFELAASTLANANEYRSALITGLVTTNPAGLRLAADAQGFRLTGPAVATSYNLELTRSTPYGVQVFHRANVAMTAGSTHSFRPTWTQFIPGMVILDVDQDSDGQTDESVELLNQAPSSSLWASFIGRPDLQLQVRLFMGKAEFRVTAPEDGPFPVEVSRNLLHWSDAGVVLASVWLPMASLPGVDPAVPGPVFIRIRQ